MSGVRLEVGSAQGGVSVLVKKFLCGVGLVGVCVYDHARSSELTATHPVKIFAELIDNK